VVLELGMVVTRDFPPAKAPWKVDKLPSYINIYILYSILYK
jgi:hypothetical protein